MENTSGTVSVALTYWEVEVLRNGLKYSLDHIGFTPAQRESMLRLQDRLSNLLGTWVGLS